MKIISVIKQVPDAEARIRATPTGIDLDGVTFVIDGMDEYGVEQSLRLREGGLDTELISLALGPKRFEEAIRTSLAMGSDRAIHIETDEALDPITQAKVLASIIQEEGAELVFVGGKEADWDSAALGPAIAEALGWPHSDWTTRLEINDTSLSVTHDSDEGSETLTLPLPAVITTQQGLNEPRYPTLPNIMKAKRKELKKLTLADVGSPSGKTQVLKQEIQTKSRLNKVVQGDAADAAKELARLLHEEAKAI
ncbi:MAG: electron transfer flavoprotein subunit beta/FixA family protein [Trueperaceae bacterium]|nr:electron transfer flavoprotein subunit beta/FixA family protein [Trueperaceae bacterium]